jgi:hypothetical protein
VCHLARLKDSALRVNQRNALAAELEIRRACRDQPVVVHNQVNQKTVI